MHWKKFLRDIWYFNFRTPLINSLGFFYN